MELESECYNMRDKKTRGDLLRARFQLGTDAENL